MEDFVTYEQAIKLKNLGFDWDCGYYYNECNQNFMPNTNDSYGMLNTNDLLDNINRIWNCISAPTLSQAQKWLRNIKDIIIVIDFDNWCEKYGCHVYKKTIYNSENIKDSYGSMLVTNESNEDFDSYEQALSMGIDKALELLN